jgi:hypothetical protein
MIYAKIGIAIAIILAAYWKGYSDEHERFLKFQAEVAAIGKAQEQANQHAIEVAEIITEGVRSEYEARIDAVRRQYAGRVQQCSTGRSNLPTLPKTTSRADELAADSRLAGLCAETTQQLISLQQWVAKQGAQK